MNTLAIIVAVGLALLFLGWLAVTIASVPLVIVIIIGAGMMIVDLIGSQKRSEDR